LKVRRGAANSSPYKKLNKASDMDRPLEINNQLKMVIYRKIILKWISINDRAYGK
jgi:hypothetical protein